MTNVERAPSCLADGDELTETKPTTVNGTECHAHKASSSRGHSLERRQRPRAHPSPTVVPCQNLRDARTQSRLACTPVWCVSSEGAVETFFVRSVSVGETLKEYQRGVHVHVSYLESFLLLMFRWEIFFFFLGIFIIFFLDIFYVMNLFFVSQNEIWEAYKIWRFIMNIFADFPNKRQRIHNIKKRHGNCSKFDWHYLFRSPLRINFAKLNVKVN